MIKLTELSIHQHLQMLQDIINRMSTKSSTLKNLCVTLVSAMIVFILSKSSNVSLLVVLVPIIIFAVLNAYYLAQEKRFRESYNDFIKNIHGDFNQETDFELNVTANLKSSIFALVPKGCLGQYYMKAVKSVSWLIFYVGLGLMVLFLECVT